MALRKLVDRITKPTEELDREQLAHWCDTQSSVRLDVVPLRRPVTVAGEIRSVRIVPRAGADALEATVHDGHGSVTAVFLGRRRIAGISPGRRVLLQGVVTQGDGMKVIYNPIYTLA